MSFNTFASGTRGYHYSRSNNPDDDIFDAAAVMSAMRASSPSAMGAAQGAADYIVPGEGSVIREGAQRMAHMTFLETLKDAVTMLATSPGARSGWISVAPRLSRTVWADTSAIARYTFAPGVSPGAEFVACITPALEATEMNNYGVLRSLSIVLWGYYGFSGRSAVPRIQIELTK